ncbi:hypothetical protein B0H19DRAFT_1186574, partial [Mycena capillaripes]
MNSAGLWYTVAGSPLCSLLLTYFIDFTRCDRSNPNSHTPAGRVASSRAINISFPYTVQQAPRRVSDPFDPLFVFQAAF